MRFSTFVLIAGSLTAAAPALAQNAAEPATNTDVTTVNAVTTDNAVVGTNEAMAAPVAAEPTAVPETTETAPPPAPAKRALPWGLLGLLGLIGLFGRRARPGPG